MDLIHTLLDRSRVHPQWQPLLGQALQSVDPVYLQTLLQDSDWLPGADCLFAAFQRDLEHCRYILFGESPYPRKTSANGIAFYDAAVDALWSESGLSKAVNRATSLRNLIKTALIAEGLIQPDDQGSVPQSRIAALPKADLIQSIAELFRAFQQRGFLMFNATPVLHTQRSVRRESQVWEPFVQQLLAAIADYRQPLPTLVLWGNIAHRIQALPAAPGFPQRVSEHPYNLSFLRNKDMLDLLAELKLMQRNPTESQPAP